MIAKTPKPPYYAVIFTSLRTAVDERYADMAKRMETLAAQQPGFLGVEAARDEGVGITVSYWVDEASIAAWKADVDHTLARNMGREKWYSAYALRVAKVERAYDWVGPAPS